MKIFMNIKYKTRALLFITILFISVIELESCKKEPAQVVITPPPPPPPPPPANRPPIANAGADQTITLPINYVQLNGSGSSDPDNYISGYVWTKIYGPMYLIFEDQGAMKTGVRYLMQGTYQFEIVLIPLPFGLICHGALIHGKHRTITARL